ncbi:MAG: FAD-dependent oxidoreductase, partial [Chloroflexia bacterium]|nr:FAD-dependent oxidoreductase [Chloroflexia bacterium]
MSRQPRDRPPSVVGAARRHGTVGIPTAGVARSPGGVRSPVWLQRADDLRPDHWSDRVRAFTNRVCLPRHIRADRLETAVAAADPSAAPDLLVIGAGAAGSTVAFEAAARGARVALAERWKVGGTCLNAGCDPTKTLVRSAEVLRLARTADRFGITVAAATVTATCAMPGSTSSRPTPGSARRTRLRRPGDSSGRSGSSSP